MIPDSSSDPRWDRLPHLFAGELSASEAAELKEWIEADPDRLALAEKLREVWDLTAVPSPGWDEETALRRIRQETFEARRVRVIAHIGERLEKLKPRRSVLLLLTRVAAVVALAGGAALLWRRAPVPPPPSPQVTVAEYTTRPGQRLSLRLIDGSSVMLAPGTTLRKPSSYGSASRTLYLEGEAYFSVAHDSAHPFTVETARAVAHDLGTEFVIRAYPSDSVTDVVVAEGVVSLGAVAGPQPSAGDTLKLERGNRGRVRSDGVLELTTGVWLDRYFAWTEGRLVFRDTPLAQVAIQLERWYDVDVRLADPELAGRRLTASFTDEPITDVLNKVAGPLGLAVTRSDRTYTLGRE